MLLPITLLILAGSPASITGDFDHDGRPDVASIHRDGPEAYALSVKRGADPHRPLRLGLGRRAPDSLDLAPADSIQATACGKGLGAHDAPCPRATVAVLKGDLLLTHAEASQAVMKWDGRRFQLKWISD